MTNIPAEVRDRRDAYCRQRSTATEDLLGWGLDGFIWQTTDDNVLKVFRHSLEFGRELAVYQRLKSPGD